MLSCGLACRHVSPQASFDQAYQAFLHGQLEKAQKEAELGWQRFLPSNPEWAWRFRILEAETLLWRGMYAELLPLLNSPPTKPHSRDSVIEMLTIEGAAYARLHQFSEAHARLEEAAQMCQIYTETACGDLMRSRGVLALQQGQIETAKQFFEQSLRFARAHNEAFLEETALLNLGAASLKEGHFDEAIDWTEDAYQAAARLGAEGESQAAVGNLGSAYYNLGDSERSLDLSREAERRATLVGNVVDQLYWTTNVGYVYASRRDFTEAKQSYLKALDLATKINSREGIYNAQRALALVFVQNGELDQSLVYSDEAIGLAQKDHNRQDELYPLLVKGLIAAQSKNAAQAERIFHEIESDDKSGDGSLKWRAEYALARLYEDENHAAWADREYRAALTTFEKARASLTKPDSRLPFSANAVRIYDDYVHFLVTQQKSDEALRWADYSRARTLSEGLGILANESSGTRNKSQVEPPLLNLRAIAERAKGTILFYWLGENQSYLWAISARKTQLFTLPPASAIETQVQRHNKLLSDQPHLLDSAGEEGSTLYRTLIAPAQGFFSKDAKVFILSDGSLSDLNFETLIVPSPKPRFWVEDADVINASSLHLLAASFASKPALPRKLLLIGDSISPSKEYPELPKSGDQMASVARHFAAAQERVYQRAEATASAYLQSHPEQFSHIHFVAHGTASRLSPLDSAIVLSKETGSPESFKLYAREIIHHPLRAELVTISSCYGSGVRRYAGEGLVGLAWAFLHAGAHNVIAASSEVSDASTDRLMDSFYNELAKGASADAALRTAKLSLLQSSAFHDPFYWAALKLYRG